MRLLVVAPRLPYPPTDGQRLRTWHLLEALAADDGFHVTLLTWEAPDDDPEYVTAVAGVVDDLVLAPLTSAASSPARRIWRQARFFAGGPPPYVQALAEERRSRPALPALPAVDAVVLEEEALVDLEVAPPGVPVVLHRLNVFSELMADVPHGGAVRRFIRPLELRAWRRFDRRVSRAAAAVVAVTPESAEILRGLVPSVPVHVVTNGVVAPPEPLCPSAGRDVAFIGWMGYPANVDAVRWFATEVWPLVRRAAPGSRLRIIGREPAPAVTALAGDDIDVTGEVPDVVAAAAGCRVGVVPLRGGMGIKNKTLELLAMGLPVVSTPAGAEGLPAPREGVLEPGTEPEAFAAAVAGLLADGEEADRLGAAGRAYVQAHFSWEAIGRYYVEVLARCQ